MRLDSLEDDEQGPILPSLEENAIQQKKKDIGPVLSSLEKENQPQESTIGKAWRVANAPMVDVSPKMKEAQEAFTKEHPYLGRIGEFGTSMMTGLTSPLGLGLTASTLGAGTAAKFGAPGVARMMNLPLKVLGGATAAHGTYQTGKNLWEGNYPEAMSGALETGVGLMGLRHGMVKQTPENELFRRDRALPPYTGPRFISGGIGKPTIDIAPIDVGRQTIHINPLTGEDQFALKKPTIEPPPKPTIIPGGPGELSTGTPPLRSKNLKPITKAEKVAQGLKNQQGAIGDVQNDPKLQSLAERIVGDETGAIGDVGDIKKKRDELNAKKDSADRILGPTGKVASFQKGEEAPSNEKYLTNFHYELSDILKNGFDSDATQKLAEKYGLASVNKPKPRNIPNTMTHEGVKQVFGMESKDAVDQGLVKQIEPGIFEDTPKGKSYSTFQKPSVENKQFKPGILVKHKPTGRVGRITPTPEELRGMTIQELDLYENRVRNQPLGMDADEKIINEIASEFKRRRDEGYGRVLRPSTFTENLRKLSNKLSDETGAIGDVEGAKAKQATFERNKQYDEADNVLNAKLPAGRIVPIYLDSTSKKWTPIDDAINHITGDTKEELASKLNSLYGKKAEPPKIEPIKPEAPTIEPIKAELVKAEPTQKKAIRASDYWQEQVDALDKAKAPDRAYRDILSTGSKTPPRAGETWRDKVLNYIDIDRRDQAKNAPPPEIEPLRAKNYIAQKNKTVGAPPTDAFDRGELEPKEEFTHKSFMQNMQDIVDFAKQYKDELGETKAAKKAKKVISDETGAIGDIKGDKKKSDLAQTLYDMYHGTAAKEDFSKFDLNKMDLGVHVTPRPETADYASNARGIDIKTNKPAFAKNQRIMPLKANMNKSLELPDMTLWKDPTYWVDNLGDRSTLRNDKMLYDKNTSTNDHEAANELFNKAQEFGKGYNPSGWRGIVNDVLKKHGYDSIKYPNTSEGEGEPSYMVLNPKQLRNRLTGEEGVLNIGSGTPAPSNRGLRREVEKWGYGKNVNRILTTDADKQANINQRDARLLSYLRGQGIDTKGKSLRSKSIQDEIAARDEEAGKMIKNHFKESPDWMKSTREAFGLTKNINLAQGIPTRSGTLSAHGFNLGGSDVMARGFKEGLKDFVKTTYDPSIDVKYIQDNKKYLKEAIESGLDWKGEEYSIGDLEKKLRNIPGIGKARDMQAKLLEDPLFKVKAPAMQLKQYMTKLNELTGKGVVREDAARQAAEWANDFSGNVNKTFKDKSLWDAAQMAFLAPSWLRTRLNIAGKGLSGKSGYVAPLARGAAIGAGIAGLDMASMGAAKYLSGKPAEVTGIPAGQTEGKKRNIEPLGTSIEPIRTAMQVGTQLGQGNIGYPFRYVGNKLSQPVNAGMNLIKNQDPFGNPLYGKTRFGKKIDPFDATLNILEEAGRPITPGLITALMDAYRGKAPLEEALARASGAPITYTSIPKGKKASTSGRLPRLK